MATPTTSSAAATEHSPLPGVLRDRVGELRKLVRRAFKSWDVDAVHQARVGTRRLKAAIDLLAPLLSDGRRAVFAKSLRQIRRTLGPIRDTDVMLLHLGQFRRPPGTDNAATWVTARLREHRSALRRQAAKRWLGGKLASRLRSWDELEPEVLASEGRAARLLKRVAPATMRDFAERADRLTRPQKPAAADETGAGRGSSEDVHELRIAGKLLRYTLELGGPLGLELPKSVSRDFKKLQEALGLWHDFAVLADEMLRLALKKELGHRRPETHGEVLALARACWETSQRHLKRFRRLWAGSGGALTDEVLGAFGTAADGDATPPAGA